MAEEDVLMTAVDTYRFSEFLHDPHSTLEIGHPDSEVYVVAVATVLTYDDDLPVVRVINIKVFPDLEVDEFEDPTSTQLEFWDMESRIIERYMWAEQECTNCGHTLRMHMEQDSDLHGCVECDCVGHPADLAP